MTYSCIFSEQFIRRPQHSWSCKWDQAHLHNGQLRFRITQLRRKDNVARESSWYYFIIENCHANSQPSISTTSSRSCPFDRHNFLCAKAGKFLCGPLRIGPIAFPQKLMLLVAINALGLALAYAALAVIEVHSKRSCESLSRLPIPDLRPDVLALGSHLSGHRDSIPTNSEQRMSSRRAIPPAAVAITFSPRFSDLNNISQRPSASLCIPKRPLSPPKQSLQAKFEIDKYSNVHAKDFKMASI